MKSNRIPRAERLRQRIAKLEAELDSCWKRKRFYPTCKRCGMTNVQVSIDGDHRVGCPMRGRRKEIEHYEKLLQVERSSER